MTAETSDSFGLAAAPVLRPGPAPALPVADTASGKNRETENFPVGSFLIRPDLRRHVHAFYNFARAADDISDHPLLEAGEKIRRLDRFSTALLDGANDELPVVSAMRASLAATGIGPQHCLDLLTAFRRDALQVRYRDWDDLLDYCRYSAAPVGRQVLALHGIGPAAWPANDALCTALQIINHIQDCADDYRQLDRVYIPQDMLAARGATVADLSLAASPPPLRDTVQAMLDRTARLLPLARRLPGHVPDLRLKLETAIIGALADALINLLRRRDPLRDAVKLGKPATLLAVLTGVKRAWL